MFIKNLFPFQVECKKAQPKEVMLPANLAKGRAAAAARGLGEFVMVGPAQCANQGVTGVLSLPNMRYSPYTLPPTSLSPSSSPSSTNNNTFHHHQAILQANIQQLQLLGVDFSSGASTTPSVPSPPTISQMFGTCKPSQTNFYGMADLLGVPGYASQGLESTSPYQVPVGLWTSSQPPTSSSIVLQ